MTFPSTNGATIFSAHDKADDITTAAELKFLIRQPLEEVRDKHGPDIRPFVPHIPERLRESMTDNEVRLQRDTWGAVAQVLDNLPGIQATTSHEVTAQSLEHTPFWKTHWIVYKANSAVPSYVTYSQADPERPELDDSAPDYHKDHWTPVEICSPIHNWKDNKEQFVSILFRIITALKTNFDIVSNESTEVHVHLGRADGKFYTLTTMKKIASLLWLAEPLLRGVKDPASRNFHHHYTWSYAWRDHSRIALALAHPLALATLSTGAPHSFTDFLLHLHKSSYINPTKDGTDGVVDVASFLEGANRAALSAIWCAADHRELGQMLRGPERKHRRLGFNFHALEQDPREPCPRTIEFRFLEGFMDAEVVPAWVQLCGALIELAMEGEEEELEDGEILSKNGCEIAGGAAVFYDAVAFLVDLPQDLPLDVQFGAFMGELGPERISRAMGDILRAVIANNYDRLGQNGGPHVFK